MERVDCAKAALTFLFAAAALSLQANLGASAAPLTIAVADFDYKDTSGEVRDQSAEHKARVAHFAEVVRENLSAQGDTSVLQFEFRNTPARLSEWERMISSPPPAAPARALSSMAASSRRARWCKMAWSRCLIFRTRN
jgi:hypothetical protein